MKKVQREAYELRQQGLKLREIAERLGTSIPTIHYRIKVAEEYLDADDGIRKAMSETGLEDISQIHSGWIKTDEASLYFVRPNKTAVESLEDIIQHIKDRVGDIKPLEPIAPPSDAVDDLMTIYPIADAHIGMRAIKEETGDDYNLDIASERIRRSMDELVELSPSSRRAIILDVGDLTHADDTSYATPKSKHALDMSGTQYESIDLAIEVLSAGIFAALRKHIEVLVRVLRGNHNENSYIAIMFALHERFRDNPRVTIEKTPSDFFVHDFGKCMFAAHHGDKGRAERLVMHMAHEWPEIWGNTKWRYYFTGHLHHAKLQDIGGVQVEQLRSVSSRDKYSATHGYVGSPQMQSITYHKEFGEKSRVKINF